jgi:hypothetical protein
MRHEPASSSKEAGQNSFLIVRQTSGGPVKIESSGMTVLQPGDLVDIVIGTDDTAERLPPDRFVPASKPGKEGPIEHASRQEIGSKASKED